MKRLLKRLFLWAADLFPYVSGKHAAIGPEIQLAYIGDVVNLEVGMTIVGINRATGTFQTGYIDYSKKAHWESK